MTELEEKLKLFRDYEAIHGLVFSEEHKKKMIDDLDLYSFIEKLNEYMALGYQSIMVFKGANNDNIQRI